MKILPRTLLLLLVLFGGVGCDQATKALARFSLADSPPLSLLQDTLRLQYAENPGAFLSRGAQLPGPLRNLIFLGFTLMLLLGAGFWLVKSAGTGRLSVSLALTLVSAGGIGNLIDRLVNHGRVIDFLNLGIGTLRTGIFNVADVAITFGVVWLALLSGHRCRPDAGPAGRAAKGSS